ALVLERERSLRPLADAPAADLAAPGFMLAGADQDGLAIGVERRRRDGIAMSEGLADRFPGGDVPEPSVATPVPGQQGPGVGAAGSPGAAMRRPGACPWRRPRAGPCCPSCP